MLSNEIFELSRPDHSSRVAWLFHDKEILGHGEILHQRYFLERGSNAELIRETRLKSRNGATKNVNRPGLGPDQPAQHLNYGRFAGTVFTKQRVHLSAGYFQTGIIQRDRRTEADGQIAYRNGGRLH